MRKISFAAAALMMGVAGQAMAADMAVKVPPRPNCPAAWFAGGYVGVNGGGVFWTANRTDQDGAIVDTTTNVQKAAGGVVGGQIGYNWVRCNTLVGIEIDGDWSSTKVTTQFFPNALPPVNVSVASRFDAIGTARVRAGVVLDNLLLYVTGGVAGARFRTTWTNVAFPPPPAILFDTGETAWGWVAGIGTEWAVTDRVSVRAEGLYVDFVDRHNRAAFIPADFTHSDSMWLARVGVNVKLDAPVVANF
jgi:outer membrane immunogenic protein